MTTTPNVPTSPAGAPVDTPSNAETVSEACTTYRSQVDPLSAVLVTALRSEAPENTLPARRLSGAKQQAVPLLSKLLRENPSLSASHTADDLDAGVSDATACVDVATDLTNVTAAANDTADAKWDAVWTMANEVYVLAKERAKTDGNIARGVADVQAMLANGKRADTAPVTAVVAQTVANRLTTQAATARQTATTKTAKANALQDGTGDATVVQPAPSAPSTTLR